MKREAVTTHVLDTALGRPGAGIPVRLERSVGEEKYQELGKGVTDSDGRIMEWDGPSLNIEAGLHRITFETQTYFEKQGKETFYPFATITFEIKNPSEHYHVPLLLSGFGYTTYRGS